MTKLKNQKHEALARAVSKGENASVAYGRLYPTANRKTAVTQAHKLMTRDDIQTRVAQILESSPKTSLEGVIKEVEGHLDAKKEIITKAGQIIKVNDNVAQGNAQDKVLKLWGAYKASEGEPAQSVHIDTVNIGDQRGERLSHLIDKLDTLETKLKRMGSQDGEIIDLAPIKEEKPS